MSTDEVLSRIDETVDEWTVTRDRSVSADAVRCSPGPIQDRWSGHITADGVELTAPLRIPRGGFLPHATSSSRDSQRAYLDRWVTPHPDHQGAPPWLGRLIDRTTRILEVLWLWHWNRQRRRAAR